jgi:NADH-quinone oxidoreductase subunit I
MIGAGILKGMRVTAWNFLRSYYDKEHLTTVSYPEERCVIPEQSRTIPFLVYDGEDRETGLRCTACGICEKECPPQVIYIVQSRDENGRSLKRPKVFDIDISACMGCQICVEVCPFEAIKMDQLFELSRRARFDQLLFHKSDLAKSNSYYRQIHPAEASAVDAKLAAAAARRKKA